MSYKPTQPDPETVKIPPTRYRDELDDLTTRSRTHPQGEPVTLDFGERKIIQVGVVEVRATEPELLPKGLMWLDTAATGPASTAGIRLVKTTTISETLTAAFDVVLVDASSGAITITLPSISSRKFKQYDIAKIDDSENSVTIDADSAETIDGGLTAVLFSQWESITIVNDGLSNWKIL